MTRIWMAGVATTAMLGACDQTKVSTMSTATAHAVEASPTTTMVAEATPVMAATSGATAAPTTGMETTAASGPKNILNLKLPKIDKTQKWWTQGVPKPDPFPAKFDPKKDYFALLHTTKGDITVKFFPEVAPMHATSFIYLSEVGYFDDAPFHRVCSDFMMQGGDPTGMGTGGPGYKIPAEFNSRKHVKGVLSAARGGGDINSAGSQFFLMFTAYPSLDGQYSVFGQVSEGMDVVEKFHSEVAVKGRPDMSCPPRSKEKIKTVDVFTKDKK